MQNKPEKIIGKKYVRGKPYFKVKWQGATKDQSSWESPAKLRQFKSMINKYEVKHWGSPLDQKFFDPSIYQSKAANVQRTKAHDKKKAIRNKKNQKKKIEQPSSDSEDPEESSSSSEEELQKVQDKKANKQELDEPEVRKKNNQKDVSIQIIDLDNDQPIEQPTKPISSSTPAKSENKNEAKQQVRNPVLTAEPEIPNNLKEVNAENEKIKPLINQVESEQEYQRDLGLSLDQESCVDKVEKGKKMPEKKLTFSNPIYLQIEPFKEINHIVHIYHLEKVHLGNHLYLVEFNDKQMKKMTTKDLLQKYPDSFVNFLENKYRAKCSVS